jgi:DNA helicase-2/ATP-dependent DNA helicase PcrA
LDFNPKQKASTSSFDKERGSSKSQDTFSKPKPRIIPKTTTLLPKAHVPTAGFSPSNTSNLQVGMDVEHERFGFGKVLTLEGNSPDVKATIFFKELGQKQLLLKFAKLRIVE